ncbi:MAG: hypothetical protein WKG03_01610 [Telluria sp.]
MSLLKKLMGIGDASVPYPFSRDYFRDVANSRSAPELICAMNDYSGYMRQAAVERAVELCLPDFAPAFVARLNDWVPQVRDAARSALLVLLPVIPADAALAILPAIVNLRHAGRYDQGDWLDRIECELLGQLTPALLFAGVRAADAKVARACFDVLYRHAALATAQLIVAALASRSDIIIGRKAAALIHATPTATQPALYRAALRSRFGVVRTMGARGYLTLASVAQRHKLRIATNLLLDTQASVRATAIAWLGEHHGDARLVYHKVLATPSSPALALRICLATLGSLRHCDDAACVSAFTSHPVSAVRAAAYAAWLKLAERDKDTIAAAALDDAAERVRKAAFDMVTTQGAYIAFPAVLSTLMKRQDWQLLLRFGRLEKWNWLEAITRLAPGDSEPLRQMLATDLQAWLGRASSFTRPTAAQLAFLQQEHVLMALGTLAGPERDLRALLARELSVAGR